MNADEPYNSDVSKQQKGRPESGDEMGGTDPQPTHGFGSEEYLETTSALQILDRVTQEMAVQGAISPTMRTLRHRIVEMEEVQDQARAAVEKLSEAVEKLRAPALRLGTLLQKLANGRALVCVNGTEYVCNLDPSLPEVTLETGTRVLLNEAFAVTDVFGFEKNGPVVRITELLPDGRLRVGNEAGISDAVVVRSTAHNLRVQIRQETGEDHPEFFLSLKGPEILNMWLGESERQVRDLFAQCREKAAEGQLAFLFIDEAESILGTRNASRIGTNILSTLVPMFCTEMDGIEPLQNVVVILASNRADLIDPAILRPGRIDRKIRVRRPDKDAGREIYKIYLTDELPLAEGRLDLVET